MLLLRHASAGERVDPPALDVARPLDRRGRADARRLPKSLAGHRIERIVSSPHRRCIETVEPIAAARGLAVEVKSEFEPDASVDQTRALLARLSDETLVCTHREVFERLFHGEVACEKGGAWKVEHVRARLLPVEYFEPPAKRAARPTRLVRAH